jgi:hypothetical protein
MKSLRLPPLVKRPDGSPPRILVASETADFRLAARQVPGLTTVVEIGCSYGVCTALLAKRAALVVAVDKSAEALKSAEQRCSGAGNVRFHQLDPFRDQAALSGLLESWEGATLLVDIGGEGLLKHCVALLRFCLSELRGLQLVVVKSRALYRYWDESGGCSSAVSPCCCFMCGGGRCPGCLVPSCAVVASAPTVSPMDNARYRHHCEEMESVDVPAHMLPRHALKYTHRLAPDAQAWICRYQNFNEAGCSERGTGCTYDHEHCWACGEVGHRAMESEVCMAVAEEVAMSSWS